MACYWPCDSIPTRGTGLQIPRPKAFSFRLESYLAPIYAPWRLGPSSRRFASRFKAQICGSLQAPSERIGSLQHCRRHARRLTEPPALRAVPRGACGPLYSEICIYIAMYVYIYIYIAMYVYNLWTCLYCTLGVRCTLGCARARWAFAFASACQCSLYIYVCTYIYMYRPCASLLPRGAGAGLRPRSFRDRFRERTAPPPSAGGRPEGQLFSQRLASCIQACMQTFRKFLHKISICLCIEAPTRNAFSRAGQASKCTRCRPFSYQSCFWRQHCAWAPVRHEPIIMELRRLHCRQPSHTMQSTTDNSQA
jgi:hypothetical protein